MWPTPQELRKSWGRGRGLQDHQGSGFETGYNYKRHCQVKSDVSGDRTPGRLTMFNKSSTNDLQEPVHWEAWNCGTLICIRHLPEAAFTQKGYFGVGWGGVGWGGVGGGGGAGSIHQERMQHCQHVTREGLHSIPLSCHFQGGGEGGVGWVGGGRGASRRLGGLPGPTYMA